MQMQCSEQHNLSHYLLLSAMQVRNEAVPGCTSIGGGATGLDYCHNPTLSRSNSIGTNGTVPALDFIGDREMELYSLQECQGDCDFDSGKPTDQSAFMQ